MKTSTLKFLIDDIDRDLIEYYDWYLTNSGYLIAYVNGKNQLLHRIIAERMGLDISDQIDHIDGNRENNHRNNLRPATPSQNAMNSKIRSNNTSGYSGVGYDKRAQKWYARIRIPGKRIWLGYHINKKDAVKVRKEAEIKYFGEFVNEG